MKQLNQIGVLASALVFASASCAASFLGIVYPKTDVTLSVYAAGVVSKAAVKVGDRVKPRQMLLQLSATTQETEVRRRAVIASNLADIEQAQERKTILLAMLADAEKLLNAGGVISEDEVRKLRLELVSANGDLAAAMHDHQRQQIELKLAKEELELYQLKAPVAGVITDFQPQVGEWVAPGDAIIRLVDTSTCEVFVKVSALAASALKLGQSLTLQVQDPKGNFPVTGTLTFVSPVADAASSLVDVRVAVQNPRGKIRAGSKAILNLGALN